MATFSRSPKQTHELLWKVVGEHYPELQALRDKKKNLTIACLDVRADLDAQGEPVGPALKHGGYAIMADISATPKKWRALGAEDVVIRIDADRWEKKSEAEQEALIDHELKHLIVRKDADDAFKLDDLGRPLFAMRLHDVEVGWFVEVAQRRGFASVEVQQAKDISEKWGQFLFDFATTENLPGLKMVPRDTADTESDGRFLLWEQLSEEQRDSAETIFGDELDRANQFWASPEGVLMRQEPIGEAPANQAAPQTGRGRKAAGGKTGAEPLKRSHKKK